MGNILIRKAQLSDANEIYEIHQQLYLTFCDLEQTCMHYIVKKIDKQLVYVLEVENEIVASITLEIDRKFFKHQLTIDALAVKQECHKTGYGTKILNFVLDNIWDRSEFKEIFVGTFQEFGTLMFYEKNWFMILETYKDIYNDKKSHTTYLLYMSREQYSNRKKYIIDLKH